MTLSHNGPTVGDDGAASVIARSGDCLPASDRRSFPVECDAALHVHQSGLRPHLYCDFELLAHLISQLWIIVRRRIIRHLEVVCLKGQDSCV